VSAFLPREDDEEEQMDLDGPVAKRSRIVKDEDDEPSTPLSSHNGSFGRRIDESDSDATWFSAATAASSLPTPPQTTQRLLPGHLEDDENPFDRPSPPSSPTRNTGKGKGRELQMSQIQSRNSLANAYNQLALGNASSQPLPERPLQVQPFTAPQTMSQPVFSTDGSPDAFSRVRMSWTTSKEELDKMEQEVRRMQRKLTASEKALEIKAKRIKQLEAENAALKAESQVEKVASLEEELATLKSKNSKLRKTVIDLTM